LTERFRHDHFNLRLKLQRLFESELTHVATARRITAAQDEGRTYLRQRKAALLTPLEGLRAPATSIRER
jgi:hypothetical protein